VEGKGETEMKKLTFGDIFTNAIQIGLQNALSVLGAVVLWILTIWIPYLNVGTTIGLIGMVTKMGRGKAISPTEIFDPKYRKQMGEFFLVMMFVSMGVYIGMAFVVIPGIVIAIAWSLAVFLVLDKGMNPMEAIQKSNDLTYGYKGTIFLATFVLYLAIAIPAMIVLSIIGWILGKIGVDFLTIVIMGALFIAVYSVITATLMGAYAYIYKTLVDSPEAGAAAQPAVPPTS